MVLAEATEVVNAIRARLKAVLGFLPPMPSISTSFKEGRIRVVVVTTNWVDSEVGRGGRRLNRALGVTCCFI